MNMEQHTSRHPAWLTALIVAWLALLSLSVHAAPHQTPSETPAPPDELWGELFYQVQTRGIYEDSKTFVDLIPDASPEAILADYRQRRDAGPLDDAALEAFVEAHFSHPESDSHAALPSGQPVIAHIDALWPILTHQPEARESRWSSRIPLPNAYVVPGGRFKEIYYWDSYFTMLGLVESGLEQRVRDMTDNFAHLIERFGHIPNGSRTYYLTRSQPPFFASMVDLVAGIEGNDAYRHYLPALQAEYDFWMAGSEALEPGQAHRRVVRLDDGTLLNRYWDDVAKPRQESFSEDLATAEAASRPDEQVWRDLRAGAESGWDFSSRWLADGETLSTIRTTSIVPVDLNSLLYHLEQTLATAYALDGQPRQAADYRERAAQRKRAIREVLWSDAHGAFGDYLWRKGRLTGTLSTATAYPLFFAIADAEQAAAGASHATIYPYGPFPTGDGQTVMLGLQNEREWQVFCEKVLEQPELAGDERFSANARRSTHRDALRSLIVQAFAALSAEDVLARLDEAQIANAHVNDMHGVWTHPQLKARQRWASVGSPAGEIPALLPPGRNSAFAPQMQPVPALGEHSERILAELGYDREAIHHLKEHNVI